MLGTGCALPDLPPVTGESKSKNVIMSNARAQLARVIGVELVAVTGLSAIPVQTIISHAGTPLVPGARGDAESKAALRRKRVIRSQVEVDRHMRPMSFQLTTTNDCGAKSA